MIIPATIQAFAEQEEALRFHAASPENTAILEKAWASFDEGFGKHLSRKQAVDLYDRIGLLQ